MFRLAEWTDFPDLEQRHEELRSLGLCIPHAGDDDRVASAGIIIMIMKTGHNREGLGRERTRKGSESIECCCCGEWRVTDICTGVKTHHRHIRMVDLVK